MRVLVTGGHGFIGRHLVRRLAEQGHRVTVLDVLAPPSDLYGVAYRYVAGDVFDPEALAEAWDPSHEGVVHLIGLADARKAQEDPERSFLLNVVSTEKVLEMCRRRPVSRFVLPSTAAVYGRTEHLPVGEDTQPVPNTIYGWHKLVAESLVHSYAQCYGVEYVVLRLFNVFGRGHKGILGLAVRSALEGKALNVFGSRQLRDFVYAGEVVDAFARAIQSSEARNVTLNIGSGVGLTIEEAVELVRSRLPGLVVTYQDGVPGVTYDSVADVTLARRVLDWEPGDPRLLIPETVQEMVEDESSEEARPARG